MKNFNRVWVGVLAALVASGAGCSKQSAQGQQGSYLVCDPFNNSTLTANNGIIGSLYRLDAATTDTVGATVATVQATGTLLDATLVLAQIFLPTILFTDGFATSDGRVVRVAGGQPLTDYFSLHLEGEIKLRDLIDDPGTYQFALIANDGAVLQVNDGAGYRVVVNADGVHPTQLNVGSQSQGVVFAAGTGIPFKLDYFQARAEQYMALTLIWRKIADPTDPAQFTDDRSEESGISYKSNELFFNPVGSTSTASLANPTADWNNLFAAPKNWKVVDAANFFLPAGMTTNPCVE